MESQNIELRAVMKFLTKEGAKAKKSISAWLMCMVIVAQSIPQWQSGQQNLNVGKSLEDDPRPGRPADVISQ